MLSGGILRGSLAALPMARHTYAAPSGPPRGCTPDGVRPAAGRRAGAPDAERLLARAIELHQAGDILGAIDTYKAALAIAPDRADVLSNLGAAYVRLGQSRRCHRAVRAGAEGGSGQHGHPPEPGARLLQVGAAASGHPRAQARRGVGARSPERVSRAGGVLPADRPGQRSRGAAEAARAAVRERPGVRLPARDGAAPHERDHRGTEVRERRVRSRRIGRGAPPHGDGVPQPAGFSRREGRARGRGQAQSTTPHGAVVVRAFAAGAR